MDRRFLLELCDAYLIDHNVHANHDKKIISQMKEKITFEVLDLVQELRDTDIELYNQLWDQTKTYQQQVIKSYLDMCYEVDNQVDENGEVIQEGLTFAGGAIITAALYYISQGQISKFTFNTLSTIGKVMESVADKIRKQGRYFKFRYAIVQRNAMKSYANCGVDPKDINVMTYMQAGQSNFPFSSNIAMKQGSCLRESYVNYVIEVICLQLKNYFACLKWTNDFSVVEKSNGNDLMKTISGLNLSAACKEHYDDVRESFSNFHDLIEFVYDDDDRRKMDMTEKLKKRVVESRDQIKRTKNVNQFNSKYSKPANNNQFNSKYSKPYRR